MRLRRIVIFCVAVTVGVLFSTTVKSKVSAQYADIMGCEISCVVAAAGWPVPFIIDYPGLSPVGSADFLGLTLGADKLRPDSLVTTGLCWAAAVIGVMLCQSLISRWNRRVHQ